MKLKHITIIAATVMILLMVWQITLSHYQWAAIDAVIAMVNIMSYRQLKKHNV